ncbi:MAG TPA: AAA family ATPase [Actinomycetota bacterium]
MGGAPLKDIAPFVGREAEIQRFRLALAAPGGLLLVAGEAGIGKSRLVSEAAADARHDARPVLWARPDQVSRPGPFALVLDLVEHLSLLPSLAEEATGLARLLAEPGDGSYDAVAARRIAARIRGLIAQTGRRPVVIFEDLHLADEASHAVIVHLARSAHDDEHLLIATYRSEEVGIAEELERFLGVVATERLGDEIALEPLSVRDAAALATGILGPGAAAQSERIAHTADGVPFYIEELAEASMREGGGDVLPGAIPGSISRAVLARTQRLGPVARHVLSVAALMPGAIEVSVLAVACDLDAGTVARALAEAARAGLVQDRDERLVFRHALVREAVAAEMVSVEAQDLHRGIATAIETVYEADLGPHVRSLAHHWYAGRDRERALFYALAAGDRALGLAATHEARTAYELAIACTDRPQPEPLFGLGEVEVREGRFPEAEVQFRRAADGWAASDRTAEAARALSRAAFTVAVGSGFAQAFDVVDEALAALGPAGEPALRASLLAQKGRMVRAGRADERRDALADAVALAEQIGDHGIRSEALDGLAWEAYFDYRIDDAMRFGLEAARAAIDAGQAEAIGRSHNNVAIILSAAGRYGEALEHLSVARDRLVSAFGSFGVMFIGVTEAITRWLLGQPNQVGRLLATQDEGWSQSQGAVRMLQAWAALHAGEQERARAAAARMREEAGWDGSAATGAQRPALDAVLCEALLALEQDEAPGDEHLEALTHAAAAEDGIADERARTLCIASRALTRAGRDEVANSVLGRFDDLLTRFPSPYYRAWRCQIAGALGEGERAATDYAGAAEIFGGMGNLVDRARAMRLAAEAAGRGEEAVADLKHARDLASEGGSHLETSRIEAALRARGVRPRAGRPKKSESAGRGGLSAREEEVTALVAGGSSNADIAARLFLSERTVQDHITHALRKLGLAGRAGLAAWAVKTGLA